jgi:3-hydroxyisobutyrate dehydrogenase
MMVGKYDFGFAVDWMRKDLSICIAEARCSGAPSGRRAGRSVLFEAQRWAAAADTSSLLARLDR